MLYCKVCQTHRLEGKFCPECGAKLEIVVECEIDNTTFAPEVFSRMLRRLPVDDLMKLSEEGIPEAQHELGCRYSYGCRGVKEDQEKAAYWGEQSYATMFRMAEQGNPETQIILGQSLCYGDEGDHKQGILWLQQAAEQGRPDALRALALVAGDDYETAEMFFQLALETYLEHANVGDPRAQSMVGYMYSNGEGIDKDDEEAFQWYKRAADNGNPEGWNNMGCCYATAWGVDEDAEQAIRCFKKSEMGECTAGIFNVALCYAQGFGIRYSFLQADKRLRSIRGADIDMNPEVLLRYINSDDTNAIEQMGFREIPIENGLP